MITTKKSREKLEKELAEATAKLEQYQHRGQRLENRIRHYTDGERKKRTHRLITRGAAVESIAPEVRSMSERAFFLLMEKVFSLPEIAALVSRIIDQQEGKKLALFHFHVTQVKRSAGQSVVTSAAYRTGEKLYSEYYSEVSDYTHKGGVVCTDILLPPQAPAEYQDRATLWNAVEKVERSKTAQLAYSFDIALQNEFSMEENIALARQFVSEQLVSRGMIADFAVHQPDKEDGGIQNPHFHILCPIRPIEESGKWGYKQRRVYRLDEDGNRIMGEDGKPLFDAVPTTDWGQPETLEHWRETWAAMVNAKFEEKGLTCRVDHRSYERQGLGVVASSISLTSPQAAKLAHSAAPPFPAEPASLGFGWVPILPTVHEGVAVRQMEIKGIATDKGDLNRWIKKANGLLRDIRKKIVGLTDWIKATKAELSKPQSPNLAELLSDFYATRNKAAWSNKAKVGNLKYFSQTVNFLTENQLFSIEALEGRIAIHSGKVEAAKASMKAMSARKKELEDLLHCADLHQELKPVYDELQGIKWKSRREKFKAEHERDLKMYHMARRKLEKHRSPAGKIPVQAWRQELAAIQQEYQAEYERYKPLRDDMAMLLRVRNCVDTVLRQQVQNQEKHQKMER